MGSRSDAFAGIRPRKSSIAIRFYWRDKQIEETLYLPPTPKNLRQAARIREEILQKIRLGIYDPADYFPSSPRGNTRLTQQEEIGKKPPTFGEMADSYLKSLMVAHSTLIDYRKSLNHYYRPVLGNRSIREIKYRDLVNLLGDVPWGKMKTRNNALVPLRGVFAFAMANEDIDVDPTARLRNGRIQRPEPDPLSLAEIEQILAWLQQHEHPAYRNLIEFAFFSGLRTSELSALRWEDIDWNRRQVRVARARVMGKIKDTKTYSVRDVDMNSRSEAALKRQKSLSYLQNREVFLCPTTGEPFITNKAVRTVWNHCLRKLGIRHRVAYQTRHSFCTNNLMAGANVMWVSRQMGHTNALMTLTRYSRWIEQANQQAETAKLESFLRGQTVERQTKTRGE